MTVAQLAPPQDVTAAVDDATAALRSIAETPMWTLTDDELAEVVAETATLGSCVDELLSRQVAAADERDVAIHATEPSTTAWLARRAGCSRPHAAKIVRGARDIGSESSALRQAWAFGQITTEKVLIIAASVNRLPDHCGPEEISDAEAMMLEFATRFDCADLRRLGNRLFEVIDPDGADEELGKKLKAEEQRASNATSLWMRPAGDGVTKGSFKIPDAQADMLRTVLEALASPKRNGFVLNACNDGDMLHNETGHANHRTRMGWALLELIEHLPKDAYPNSGGVEATVVVNIDFDALASGIGTATLSTGTEISASQARRIAANARLIPAVLDGDSRILDLGTSRRLYDRYQRIAIGKRDKGCTWPGCDRPPAWCEVHHMTEWQAGGPTDIGNGALVCSFHHRILSKGEWQARLGDDNIVEIIPPPRIDPQRTPRRHQRHEVRLSPRTL